MKNNLLYEKSYYKKYGNSQLSYSANANNPTFNKRLNELKSLGFKSGKILDVGCAYGYFLKACEDRGFETYGVDISDYAINNARKICRAKLKVIDVQKNRIPFKSSAFDAVFLMDVLEHLENPYFLLRETSRLLKKGGILYIHLPLIKRAIADNTHRTFFVMDSFRKTIEIFPFKFIRLGEEGGIFSELCAIFRLLVYRNTNFNYVPSGTGSFISGYLKKV